MASLENRNIALLIDAENISADYIEIIIDEANKHGKINYRRVYGDWTTSQLNPWKQKAIEFGLTPIQQYKFANSKNVSDFTLIIDAMDILYSNKVDSFCIVSSDSDFTKLVTRLKEDNMFVFGMGESKTPISLVNSCETFSYLDKMKNPKPVETKVVSPVKEKTTTKKKRATAKAAESSITPSEEIFAELKNLILNNREEDGWAYYSLVAELLQKKFPGFHPRNYGDNVKPLVYFKKHDNLEFETRETSVYVRIKPEIKPK